MALGDNEVDFLWSQRYRPRTVEETILPKKTKAEFQKFVEGKNIPNLLLFGPPGMGKTTSAKAMLEQLDCDYLTVNGSMHGGIDTLRGEIASFASSVSFRGGRKYVLVDEADHLTDATQKSFRSFSEEFSKNCGFIFTCNFLNRIIEPLHSRFGLVDFNIPKSEKEKILLQFFKRVTEILEKEGVEYDKKVLAQVITKYFPDFRRTLNELQKYAANGSIDAGILNSVRESSIEAVFELMKNKNFTGLRKWCAENSDQDATAIYRELYDAMAKYVRLETQPGFIVTLGTYMHRHASVADPEINLAACLTEIMIESEFT